MNGNRGSNLYPLARTVLLDALSALREHADAVILVGAQAIYLHTGDADLALAPYTADADLAINPAHLSDAPTIAKVMHDAGFLAADDRLGTWEAHRKLQGAAVTICVDLLVPSTVAGGGRRGARLGVHGERVARHAKGRAIFVQANHRPQKSRSQSVMRILLRAPSWYTAGLHTSALNGQTSALVPNLFSLAFAHPQQGGPSLAPSDRAGEAESAYPWACASRQARDGKILSTAPGALPKLSRVDGRHGIMVYGVARFLRVGATSITGHKPNYVPTSG